MSNLNYSMQTPRGYIDQLALKKRLNMLRVFLDEFPDHTCDSILDVGVTADADALSSNFLEKYHPQVHKIIALSNQNAHFLEDVYPGIKFMQGDAREIPLDNNSVDIVFSAAVIEHLGSRDNQVAMLRECYRVARKGVFITTPNRWHPVEVHTLLPLLHWLPKPAHRKLLGMLGMSFYAQEENLNLLDRRTLMAYCAELGIRNYTVKSIRTAGFASNLLLVINK